MHLAAQDVEIIGWRCAVGDLDIIFRTKLEIAFKPCRAMLWPLPFIAVRQQHHEAIGAQPFGLTCGNELVNHHLSAIGEIAELAFPKNKALRIGAGKAIFKAQHAKFGQGAVQHLKAAMRHSGKRNIFLLARLIDPHSMTLAECATARVLA